MARALRAAATNGFFSRLQAPIPTVRASSTSWPLDQVAGSVHSSARFGKRTTFYKNILGAPVSEAVPLPEHEISVVFVNLGNTKMELLHALGCDSPIAGFLQKNKAGGMHHICIEMGNNILMVDNGNAAVMDLTKKICSLSEKVKIGAHGKPVVFLHPKDYCAGVLVEVEQA
uniref:Methylmalonyl-CoA epimerase, mitochondrial n=2 Tax=Rhinopithecus TaxID=542827 RepID=A0A2K6L476_RHIBE